MMRIIPGTDNFEMRDNEQILEYKREQFLRDATK